MIADYILRVSKIFRVAQNLPSTSAFCLFLLFRSASFVSLADLTSKLARSSGMLNRLPHWSGAIFDSLVSFTLGQLTKADKCGE